MAKSPSHIFISFKSEESQHALQLEKALEEAGYKVWLSIDLQSRQEWHGEIDKAIQSAGAVIVLWSHLSMKSTWVKHEASQAIIKNIYVPVRIELVEIETPYNRIQAVDLKKEEPFESQAGFQHLLHGLRILMPKTVPLFKKTFKFFWQQRIAFIIGLISLFAFFLLWKQQRIMSSQVTAQQKTAFNVERQVKKLDLVSDSLSSQNLILKEQVKQQKRIVSDVQKQSETLKNQVAQQNEISKNIERVSEPLKNISFDVVVNIDSNCTGYKEYSTFLTKKTQSFDSVTNAKVYRHLYTFDKHSNLWPAETFCISNIIQDIAIHVYIFVEKKRKKLSFLINLSSEQQKLINEQLVWNSRFKTLTYRFTCKIDENEIESKGALNYVSDLIHSTVAIDFDVDEKIERIECPEALLSNFSLQVINCNFSGRTAVFSTAEMQKITSYGISFFFIKFEDVYPDD